MWATPRTYPSHPQNEARDNEEFQQIPDEEGQGETDTQRTIPVDGGYVELGTGTDSSMASNAAVPITEEARVEEVDNRSNENIVPPKPGSGQEHGDAQALIEPSALSRVTTASTQTLNQEPSPQSATMSMYSTTTQAPAPVKTMKVMREVYNQTVEASSDVPLILARRLMLVPLSP